MANWPATLPQQVLLDGHSEGVPDTAIRTQMDAGPAKLRQRTTTAVRPIAAALLLTSAQVTTLDTFYVSTLSGGTLDFDWEHPRTKAAATFRFTAPPTYVPLGNGIWRTALALELMP